MFTWLKNLFSRLFGRKKTPEIPAEVPKVEPAPAPIEQPISKTDEEKLKHREHKNTCRRNRRKRIEKKGLWRGNN